SMEPRLDLRHRGCDTPHHHDIAGVHALNRLLLSLILMTGAARSADDGRILLTFDAPVTFMQTLASAPPRVIISVPDAKAAPGLSLAATQAGVAVTAGADPRSLRITVPVPDLATASVAADGSRIVVTFDRPETSPVTLSAKPVTPPSIVTAPAATPSTQG